MNLDYQTMIRLFSQMIWPMARIGGLLLTVPVFSSVLIPTRIKVIFIMALSWVSAPLVPQQLSFIDFNGFYLVYAAREFFLGLLMGFILQLVFQVFVLGGQLIAMQSGLGFAVMVDPSSKASVPLVGQLYLMMITLIFFSLNGHLALIQAFIDGFKVLPIGQFTMENSMVWQVLSFSGWMFKEALLISIPAVLSLLIVNLAFGIMARAAPQLNIFSLGFPISLLMVMVIIKVGLSSVGAQMADAIEQGMNFLIGILR